MKRAVVLIALILAPTSAVSDACGQSITTESLVAEMIDMLMSDRELRQKTLAGQKSRLACFSPEIIEEKLRNYLASWLD